MNATDIFGENPISEGHLVIKVEMEKKKYFFFHCHFLSSLREFARLSLVTNFFLFVL